MDDASARRRRHARNAGTVSVHELQARATPAEQASLSAIQARAAEEANALTAPLRFSPEELRRAIAQRDAARAAVRPAGHSTVPPARRTPEPEAGPEADADTVVGGLPLVPPEPVEPGRPVRPGQPARPGAAEPAGAETGRAAPDGDGADTGPAREPDGPDAPRTPGRLVTTIVVTLAVMVALGAVTAVGAARTEPQRLSPAPPAVQPALLEGPAVLRPDRIVAELMPATHPSAAATSWLDPLPTAAAPDEGPLADVATASTVVNEFYGDLPLRPAEAFQRLAPAMHGDGEQSFVAAWRQANSVDAVVRGADDGSLRVAVSISRPREGEVIRLIQRIEVRPVVVDGVRTLLITDAELIAAHRE